MAGKRGFRDWIIKLLLNTVGKNMLKDYLTLKFLEGWRTKIIGGGMVLGGVSTILAHLGKVIGGDEQLNWELLKGAGLTVATGFGLITAAVHKPTV